MGQKIIPQLEPIPEIDISDEMVFPVDTGLHTYKITLQQLKEIFGTGGGGGGGDTGGAETDFTILNGQLTPAEIPGFIIDKTIYSAFRARASYTRRTLSFEYATYTEIVGVLKPSGWVIEQDSTGDEPTIRFYIDADSGQISYTSEDIAGIDYEQDARWKILDRSGPDLSNTNFTILNDQTAPEPVVGLVIDPSYSFFKARLSYVRKTDLGERATYTDIVGNLKSDGWYLEIEHSIDFPEVDFSIDSVGQVFYTSDNMAGADYESDGMWKILDRSTRRID